MAEQLQKVKAQQLALTQARHKERYEDVLKGREYRIPNNQVFETKLKGVDSMTIMAGGKPESRVGRYGIILLNYKAGGKPAHVSLRIEKDGKLADPLPRALSNLKEDSVIDEALDRIEAMDLEHLVMLDHDILRPGEALPTGIESGIDPKRTGTSESRIEPERLEFLKQLKGKLFTAVPRVGGFHRYQVTGFKDFALLESQWLGNAAYFVPFKEPLSPEYDRKNFGNLSDERKQELIENLPWPIATPFSKSEILATEGASRIIHHPKNWRDDISNEVFRRQTSQ